MFDKQYYFYGRHAVRGYALRSEFGGEKEKELKAFKSLWELYTVAPLVGFLYQRRADVDKEKDPSTGDTITRNILKDQVLMARDALFFAYSMVMLLDAEYEPDEEKRLDKAFRHRGDNPDDEARFNSYVLGGIDVLYEKLIEEGGTPDEYAMRLIEFVQDFDEKFNKNIDLQTLSLLAT